MQVVSENKLKCLFFFLSLVLLIAVTVIAGGSSSVAKRQRVAPLEPNSSARAYALFAGIPQHGPVLGYRKAPVTLQFFGDLQCLDSRWVMLGVLPFLIRRWVRTGELQIRFRSTETDTSGGGGWSEFKDQQGAAMAAGRQDKLWNFIDVFYREQGPEFSEYVDGTFLWRIAKEAGLDIERWEVDRQALEDWVPHIETDEALAKAKRVGGTPSFLIGPTGGRARVLRHFSFEEPGVFEGAIRGLS
jgi:protein-disulfide isomerase